MNSFKILKSDLKKSPQLNEQLHQLSESVLELDNAFVYSPDPRKLMEFMTILSRSGIKSETGAPGKRKPLR